MAKAVYLASFGAQSLKNSTTLKQYSINDSADTVVDPLVLDVDGNWYDTAGSSAAKTIPGTVSCEIKVSGTSAANFKANTNAIEALNATKATLTGTYADATTTTCTARCTVEEVSVDTSSFLVPMVVYRLTFQKLTSWT